jgi:hypothetical protein
VPLTTDGVSAAPTGRAQELAAAPPEQPEPVAAGGPAAAGATPAPKSDSVAVAQPQTMPIAPSPASTARTGASEASNRDPVTRESSRREARQATRRDRSQSRRTDRRRERQKTIAEPEASENVAQAPTRETVRMVEEPAPTGREATRGRETFGRAPHDERRYGRDDSGQSQDEARRGREETRAPSRETRRGREEKRREGRRSRDELARVPREEAPRGTRLRAEDDDDYVVVRPRRVPDGRQLTSRERRIEESRSAVPAEEPARPKLPFFLSIFDQDN